MRTQSTFSFEIDVAEEISRLSKELKLNKSQVVSLAVMGLSKKVVKVNLPKVHIYGDAEVFLHDTVED